MEERKGGEARRGRGRKKEGRRERQMHDERDGEGMVELCNVRTDTVHSPQSKRGALIRQISSMFLVRWKHHGSFWASNRRSNGGESEEE